MGIRFTARRKLNPPFSDLSGSLEKDEGCAQVSDSELLPKEKKNKRVLCFPPYLLPSASTEQQLTRSAATVLQSCEKILH